MTGEIHPAINQILFLNSLDFFPANIGDRWSMSILILNVCFCVYLGWPIAASIQFWLKHISSVAILCTGQWKYWWKYLANMRYDIIIKAAVHQGTPNIMLVIA